MEIIGESNNPTKTVKFDGFSVAIDKEWLMNEINKETVLFKGPKIGKGHLIISIYRSEKEEIAKELKIAVKNDIVNVDYKLLYITKMKLYDSKRKNFRLLSETELKDVGFEDKGVFCEFTFFKEELNSEVLVRNIYSETEEQFIILSTIIPGGDHLKSILKLSSDFLNSFKILKKQ